MFDGAGTDAAIFLMSLMFANLPCGWRAIPSSAGHSCCGGGAGGRGFGAKIGPPKLLVLVFLELFQKTTIFLVIGKLQKLLFLAFWKNKSLGFLIFGFTKFFDFCFIPKTLVFGFLVSYAKNFGF